jgi:hypothetical protein
MTKKILAILTIIISVTALAKTQATTSISAPSTSTPVRFSFWPNVWQWPKGVNVYGWSLGLPDSYDTGNVYVAGVDMALFRSSSNVKGLQMAGGNIGKNSAGVQIGIANMYENFNGAQIGLYDESKNSTGLQLGAVNKATSSKNMQIGVINMMDDGFFPVFPIINFPKKWISK